MPDSLDLCGFVELTILAAGLVFVLAQRAALLDAAAL
jgi:hypothetical protein